MTYSPQSQREIISESDFRDAIAAVCPECGGDASVGAAAAADLRIQCDDCGIDFEAGPGY